MNDTKLTFKRTEKKYLLSAERFAALWQRIGPYMEPDEYPESTVCSIYYDTDDYRLIRHSIEGPVYKEKLRLRSYLIPGPEDPVFVELKKKYKGVVYKRRVELPARVAQAWLDRGEALLPSGELLMEIKTPTAAPLWLARALSELQIFPVSFSKYGTCYKEHILHEYILGGSTHA